MRRCFKKRRYQLTLVLAQRECIAVAPIQSSAKARPASVQKPSFIGSIQGAQSWYTPSSRGTKFEFCSLPQQMQEPAESSVNRQSIDGMNCTYIVCMSRLPGMKFEVCLHSRAKSTQNRNGCKSPDEPVQSSTELPVQLLLIAGWLEQTM